MDGYVRYKRPVAMSLRYKQKKADPSGPIAAEGGSTYIGSA